MNTFTNHHAGLFQDAALMRTHIRRRRMLALLAGGGTAALLAGCGGTDGTGTSSTATTTATTGGSTGGGTTGGASPPGGTAGGTTTNPGNQGNATCIADPTETNGPYPADGTNSAQGSIVNVLSASGIVRSDIRSSIGISTNTAPGVPLTLTITLVNSNAACAPLAGYAIYIWHCDREGNYSLYDLPGENFLRGVQQTDANGRVTFTTIYPGTYSGRYPHIHFEVYPSLASATSAQNARLTSQFAMPRSVTESLYAASSLYTSSISRLAQITTASDNVFGDNTAEQIAMQTPTVTGSVSAGYTGTVTVGLLA